MRLGDHFLTSTTCRTAPVRPVKFRAIGKSIANGELLVADVEATMVFVDESERQSAIRDANKEVALAYGDKPPPQDRIDDEITYQVLFRALRDSSSDLYRVAFAANVKELKNALTMRTANELWEAYHAFVREEFPDYIEKDEFTELVKEAESKSLAALLRELGFFKILRLLPSLAAQSGT